MAAFDSIELFGIGRGRAIDIVRHARARSSGSSFSLPSVGSPALEWPCLEASGIAKRSSPPHPHNITPENSVFGPTFGLVGSSPGASPNVSSNEGWTPDATQLSSLERYIQSHERHETIPLFVSAAFQLWPKPVARNIRENIDSDGHVEHKYSALDDQPVPSDNPMSRYLAGPQRHERLALFLDRQHRREDGPKPPDQDPQETDTSISLSGGADVEEDNHMVAVADAMRRFERRKEQALSQPRRRLFKLPLARKRTSESPPQGHRDKMARRS
ncbi:hypothetical protein C8A00DRAFT_16022 [Chaetomidium leptoderma]|uniref:Uncharacterized protein n=1 Tax=Chaetomidium leptoderma TaxID=669021 RepID=A0AAN6VKA5_9PEZI|nr:hypothetical protein C8A00DRAFT_16022 [Chaetomidium leptoderma]